MDASEKLLKIKGEVLEVIRDVLESVQKSAKNIEEYRRGILFEEGQIKRKQGEIEQRTAELLALEWIAVHQNDEWEGKQEFAAFLDNPVLRPCKKIVYARTAHWGCGCELKDLKKEVRAGIIRLCQQYGYKVVLMEPNSCGWQMPILGLVEYIYPQLVPDWYEDAGLENPEIL
jgi:hypothetical protein